MTSAQTKRLYFPTWRRCFTQAWQQAESGHISPAPDAPDSDARDLVEAHARSFASREVRGVTETDLRHAATALAIQHARSWRMGRQQPLPSTPEASSSRRLDSLGLDMFRALCALVADPLWLGTTENPGMIWWEDPGAAEQHRILVILDTRTAAGYAASLARDMYGTRDYHGLSRSQLTHLYRLMLGRSNAWRPDGVRVSCPAPHEVMA
jgi:hypothetical protein